MSFTTFFQFTHTSYLPLPPTKYLPAHLPDSPIQKPETASQIQQRGLETAVKMLHEPELIISLNPLVQHYEIVPPIDHARLVNLDRLAPEFNVTLAPTPSCSHFSNSTNGEFVHYEIIDKFTFLGGLTSKLMTYRACFRPLYDADQTMIPKGYGRDSIGVETISDPGSGVALLGKWIVSKDERKAGFLVLTENVQVHCNVFLGWYVRGQLGEAHAALHKEFGRRFCERMVEEEPGKGGDERAGRTWEEVREGGERRLENGLPRTGTGSTSRSGGLSRVGTDQMQ